MFKKSDFIKKHYTTGDIAKILGKKPQTIIKLDRDGKLPFKRTSSSRRIMFKEDLFAYLESYGLLIDDGKFDKRDIIYARVSSNDQKLKGDLDRQVVSVLEFASNLSIINPLILKEVGSGLNDNRKQIQKLIFMIMDDQVNRIFINYKDRLTRFGYNYLETVCKLKNVEIIVVNDDESKKDAQEEMVEDMISLIASFSGKLYGMRSRNKKKSIELIESIPEIE